MLSVLPFSDGLNLLKEVGVSVTFVSFVWSALLLIYQGFLN